MLEILKDYAPLISAVSSIGTLTIWAIYLHIFVGSHQRHVKPMLVINRGEGRTLDARCLLTNMSPEPVHIQSVLVKLQTAKGSFTAYISDAEDIRRSGDQTGWQRITRQGPLQPGTMIDMGSYRGILDYTAHVCVGEDAFQDSALAHEAQSIEIAILGIYGSEDLLIGATRKFELDRETAPVELRAVDVLTRQITKRKERRRLSKELACQL